MRPNDKEIARDLREHRKAAGLSQQTVAERAHCSISMVQLLEAGYAPRRGEVLDRVLAVVVIAPVEGGGDGGRPWAG